jgi:hypothetical protein
MNTQDATIFPYDQENSVTVAGGEGLYCTLECNVTDSM